MGDSHGGWPGVKRQNEDRSKEKDLWLYSTTSIQAIFQQKIVMEKNEALTNFFLTIIRLALMPLS